MTAREQDRPNVMVLDETAGQAYMGLISEGVRMAGGIVMPYDDLAIALEDCDDKVSAIVTTLDPLSTSTAAKMPESHLALISQAHELDVPLGIVSMQMWAVALMRPSGADAFFDSYPSRTDLLPGQIVRWLGRAGVRYFPKYIEVTESGQTALEEGPHTQAAALLLGSDAKMRLGISMANLDATDGVINAPLATKLGSQQKSTATKILQIFCDAGLIERADGGPSKGVSYRKTNSPLWGIYKAAQGAIEELNKQQDLPE